MTYSYTHGWRWAGGVNEGRTSLVSPAVHFWHSLPLCTLLSGMPQNGGYFPSSINQAHTKHIQNIQIRSIILLLFVDTWASISACNPQSSRSSLCMVWAESILSATRSLLKALKFFPIFVRMMLSVFNSSFSFFKSLIILTISAGVRVTFFVFGIVIKLNNKLIFSPTLCFYPSISFSIEFFNVFWIFFPILFGYLSVFFVSTPNTEDSSTFLLDFFSALLTLNVGFA